MATKKTDTQITQRPNNTQTNSCNPENIMSDDDSSLFSCSWSGHICQQSTSTYNIVHLAIFKPPFPTYSNISTKKKQPVITFPLSLFPKTKETLSGHIKQDFASKVLHVTTLPKCLSKCYSMQHSLLCQQQDSVRWWWVSLYGNMPKQRALERSRKPRLPTRRPL